MKDGMDLSYLSADPALSYTAAHAGHFCLGIFVAVFLSLFKQSPDSQSHDLVPAQDFSFGYCLALSLAVSNSVSLINVLMLIFHSLAAHASVVGCSRTLNMTSQILTPQTVSVLLSII